MKQSILTLCLALVLAPAYAKSKPEREPESRTVTQATAAPASKDQWLRFSINDEEQRELRSWQKTRPQDLHCSIASTGGKALPKGQQKKQERTGEVSKGWQKKIARGETLPPEIVQQCRTSIPPELIRRLPPPPPGTILIGVDGKVVRLIEATREIIDVLDLF